MYPKSLNKSNANESGSKKKKKSKKNKEEVEHWIFHLTPQIKAKTIVRHPVKYEIFAIYDKDSSIQVICMNPDNYSECVKYSVIENEEEIKSVEFTKDSLLWVLCTSGFVKVYNYNIPEILRASFHPYMNQDTDNDAAESSDSSKTFDVATSIYCPLVEIDHELNEKFREFKEKRNLITQGTLITSRHKNSEFTIWDIHTLLKDKIAPRKLHTINIMGKSKAKKCILDFSSNSLLCLMKNKGLIFSIVPFTKECINDVSDTESPDDTTIRFKKVYIDLVSK